MLSVRRGTSRVHDTERVADEIAAAIAQDGAALGIVFVSPRYDLEQLAPALHTRLGFPIIGCTTAGQVTSEHGYARDSVEAVSIAGPGLRVVSTLIEEIDTFDHHRAKEVAADLFRRFGVEAPRRGHSFAFVLFDGLALAEERGIAELFAVLEGLPIVGGSAGDDLAFLRTLVMADGRASINAAVVCIVEAPVPVMAFREQHFAPTSTRMVITRADPSRRLVTEIDGKPATVAYAEALGLEPGALDGGVFSANPVTVMLDGEPWVRAIQRIEGADGLVFFCAIAEGTVLRLARGSDLVGHLEKLLDRLDEQMGGVELVIGCDCILRRLELEKLDQLEAAGQVLARVPFFGFSTYGEQLDAVHINQTLTGLVLGGRHPQERPR